jgi:hypothetical protein
MAANLPNSEIKKRRLTEPKAGVPKAPKPARLRAFPAPGGVQCCPPHCPPQPGPNLAQHGPFLRPPAPAFGPPASGLGQPLGIEQAAELVGCSPWTVRQTLIPRGLPHLRFSASGRLIFYRDQVIRWIENQQGGNK